MKLKCLFYISLGCCLGFLIKKYEEEISCTCKKMMKFEKNMMENGLDIN